MSDSMTRKIAALLNQAENTSGPESDAFMARAQALATAHSVDLAKARHATKAKERTVPVVQFVELGKKGTRGLNTYVQLITGIAHANDLRLTIKHNSTGVHLYGFQEDVDITIALYMSLLAQMSAATIAFKKEGTWKLDTTYRPYRDEYYNTETGKKISYWEYQRSSWNSPVEHRYVGGDYVPISWLTARLDFQQAFATKVGSRLMIAANEAKANLQQEAVDAGDTSTALVLVDKTKSVDSFYKDRSNARGTYRGGRDNIGSYRAHAAGHKAGDNARLSSQTGLGGARKAIG